MVDYRPEYDPAVIDYYNTGQQPASAAPAAAPAQAAAYDPYGAYNAQRRASAFDDMSAALSQYGIDVNGSGLAATIRGWVEQDKSPAWMQIELRNTPAYKQRFPGMQALIARGQAISEAEYIQQERSYSNVMRSYGVPASFFDGPEDFGKLISNGVSVKELDDRVNTAETFLNSRPEVRDAFKQYYNVDSGALLGYVLDADKGQALIQQQAKAALAGGSAAQYGFTLDKGMAEQVGGTLGTQYDAIGNDQLAAQQQQFAKLGATADNQGDLASIDKDTAWDRNDTISSEILNDNSKALASQQRRQREQSRFGGSGAVTTGTLTRNRT